MTETGTNKEKYRHPMRRINPFTSVRDNPKEQQIATFITSKVKADRLTK